MNLAVEAPTSVIKLKINPGNQPSKESYNQNIHETLWSVSQSLEKSAKINFYEFSNASLKSLVELRHRRINAADVTADATGDVTGDIQHTLFWNKYMFDQPLECKNGKLPESLGNGEVILNDSYTNHAGLEESNFYLDFFIIGLKNDLRVKSFKTTRKMIFIYFYTVQDSISFYKQYFKVSEMSFSYPYEFERLCFEITDNKTVELKENWLENHTARSNETESIPRVFEPVMSSIVQHEFKPVMSSIVQHEFKHEFNPPIKKSIFEPIFHESNSQPVKENSCKTTIKESFIESKKFKNDNSTSERKKQFLQRVEYFNKMGNFYTKNDIKKMETLSTAGIQEFIFLNTKELSCGSFSNVIMQDAIKTLNENEVCEIIKNLGFDIAPISATKYGAYTVQSVILAATTTKPQKLISYYFRKYGEFLLAHEIGNYSIQKVLRLDEDLVYGMCMDNIVEIVDSDLGFKVFKRCIEFFSSKTDNIVAKLNSIKNAHNSERCDSLILVSSMIVK